MNNLPFIRSAIVGFMISAATAVLYLSLSISLDTYSAIALSCTAATLAYLIYLLSRSESKLGRVLVVTMFCVSSVALLLMSPPISVLTLINITLIWAVRTCYFHQRVLVALADLVLSALTLTAAIAAAMQSHNAFIAFWSFFLAQSMILPALNYCIENFGAADPYRARQARSRHALSSTATATATTLDDNFQRAHRNAEAAVSRLAQQSVQHGNRRPLHYL